jgi:hypothetical protein
VKLPLPDPGDPIQETVDAAFSYADHPDYLGGSHLSSTSAVARII